MIPPPGRFTSRALVASSRLFPSRLSLPASSIFILPMIIYCLFLSTLLCCFALCFSK
ncbi:hypothetical protein LINPERPRIM_LOCUS3141 [Linum perenne]